MLSFESDYKLNLYLVEFKLNVPDIDYSASEYPQSILHYLAELDT